MLHFKVLYLRSQTTHHHEIFCAYCPLARLQIIREKGISLLTQKGVKILSFQNLSQKCPEGEFLLNSPLHNKKVHLWERTSHYNFIESGDKTP